MPEQTLHIAVSLIGAVVAAYFMFSQLRKARIIDDAPTSKIRSAAQGFVELSGVAKLLDERPVFSPLTDESCLWCHYKIER